MVGAANEIKLPDELTIGAAESLQGLLSAALSSGEEIIVDAGQVQRADAAGMQVLLACANEVAAAGQTLRWSGVSDPFLNAARLLGMREGLHLKNQDNNLQS